MVFAVVSVALIWKRLYNRELPLKEQMMPFSLLALMVLASIGEQQQQQQQQCLCRAGRRLQGPCSSDAVLASSQSLKESCLC